MNANTNKPNVQNGIVIPEKNINWNKLEYNPNAHTDKIDWSLTVSSNAIPFSDANLDKINWSQLSTNSQASTNHNVIETPLLHMLYRWFYK